MSDLRTAAQQALEALEWHYRQGHSNTLGGFRLKIDEKALRELRAALAQQAEPVQDQRCRAEPRSDGDFVCDCKIGKCPGRSAEPAQEPVAWECKSGGLKPLTQRQYDAQTAATKRHYTRIGPPQRQPLTEGEMYAVDEEARKNFRLSQKGPRGQQITYWDGLTPWLIRAVERAHGIKE